MTYLTPLPCSSCLPCRIIIIIHLPGNTTFSMTLRRTFSLDYSRNTGSWHSPFCWLCAVKMALVARWRLCLAAFTGGGGPFFSCGESWLAVPHGRCCCGGDFAHAALAFT